MIVSDDKTCCVLEKDRTENCPAINRRLCERSHCNHFCSNDIVRRCQVNEPDLFMVEISQLVMDDFLCRPAGGEHFATEFPVRSINRAEMAILLLTLHCNVASGANIAF